MNHKNKLHKPGLNIVIRISSLLLVSILISNCSVKQSDFDKLKSENDSLIQILAKDEKLSSTIASKQLKLYVGTGAMEDNMVDDHLEMVSILKRFNAGNIMIKSEILDHETHRTIFGRGFTNGLRFLYAKD